MCLLQIQLFLLVPVVSPLHADSSHPNVFQSLPSHGSSSHWRGVFSPPAVRQKTETENFILKATFLPSRHRIYVSLFVWLNCSHGVALAPTLQQLRLNPGSDFSSVLLQTCGLWNRRLCRLQGRLQLLPAAEHAGRIHGPNRSLQVGRGTKASLGMHGPERIIDHLPWLKLCLSGSLQLNCRAS